MAPSLEAARDGSLEIPHEMEAPLPANGQGAPITMNPEAVNTVMYSEIGINVLLNRLKQSIASAKARIQKATHGESRTDHGQDFSGFLSKRARLEDEHVQGLRKLGRLTAENARKPESRQGSYLHHFSNVCQAQDRMAEHGAQFAGALQSMHTDLDELISRMDRGRRHWKQDGLSNEKKVKDAEQVLEKAKSKYDSTADSYDRARTGGNDSGRVFTVKGPKSAEKHEEDLLRKLQIADSDYQAKVQAAQNARQENLSQSRPQAVKTLQELIRECDSALTLQLQKFAALSEKLIVGCGMEVSPVKGPDGERSGPPSMRDMIQEIDNERDFHGFIVSHSQSVPKNPGEIRYEKHPTLGPTQQAPSRLATQTTASQPGGSTVGTASSRISMPLTESPQTSRAPTLPLPSEDTSSQAPPATSFGMMQTGNAPQATQTPASNQADQYRDLYQNPQKTSPTAPQGAFPQGRQGNADSDLGFVGGPPPYQPGNTSAMEPSTGSTTNGRSPSEFAVAGAAGVAGVAGAAGAIGAYNHRSGQTPQQQGPPTPQKSISPSSPASNGNGGSKYGSMGDRTSSVRPAPTKPVFGQNLEALFRRDDLAVPLVVYQCIQAVDLFGLEVEGIYRLSGDSRHVNQLKTLFDSDAAPDFRSPPAFHHDVNIAAGLLKQFFRELPDPLFTSAAYTTFIDAAKLNDENERRDGIHAVINGLPDPNYATMRALILHLHRVMDHAEANRMNSHNLAICFAPALMGQHTGPQIADAGLQARVLDTILKNTYQIFDED